MTVLVTGGAGFIGSAVCRHLVNHTRETVVNVDKLTYAGNLASLASVAGHARYHFIRADICDRPSLEDLFARFRPQCVLHLAAESHVDRSISASDAFIRTNICGTHALLETARAHFSRGSPRERTAFRFIHVSTDEVFGSLGSDGHFDEDTAYDPSSPYSASKASADHLVRAWGRTFGLPVIVTNCSNNFGPFHYPEKLIPLTILNALHGRPLPVYSDGSNVRDWLYVEDHVRALDAVRREGKPGRTYSIGGGSERTNIDVVRAVCRLLDARRPMNAPHERLITFVADRPGHDFRYAVSSKRLEQETGWRPVETFESGLARTVDWYLGNAAWWEPLVSNAAFSASPPRVNAAAEFSIAG